MNPPEYSPSELEAMRLQRDINSMVEKQCPREDEFDKFEKQAARKTKRKIKHDSIDRPTGPAQD